MRETELDMFITADCPVLQCLASPCEGGRCLNVPGSFQCSCQPGFMLDSSGRQCEDQDECLLDNGGCSQLCLNRPGDRECQ